MRMYNVSYGHPRLKGGTVLQPFLVLQDQSHSEAMLYQAAGPSIHLEKQICYRQMCEVNVF